MVVDEETRLRAPEAMRTPSPLDAQVEVDETAAAGAPIARIEHGGQHAAGDLLVGDGTGSFGTLTVGTDGQILAVGPGGSPQWVDDSSGDVTSVAATAPITVDDTDPQVPVIGVDLGTTATPGVLQVELTGNLTLVNGVIDCPNGSTTVKGAVQLANNTTTDDATLALTAAAGYDLQGQINALTLAGNVILAGGYDAATGLVDGVTTQGAAAELPIETMVDSQRPRNNGGAHEQPHRV